jgi:hypothetical protein
MAFTRRTLHRAAAPAAAAVACALLVLATPAAAQPPGLPDPVPVPSLPAIEPPVAASTRLVTVPAGCGAPTPERVVFVGNVTVTDTATARYEVQQVLSGTTSGYEVRGLIDIRYGDDVRFLAPGTTYIVGAGLDPDSGVLYSNVRPPAPLSGGSDVAGVNVSDVDCPRVEDPIRTLSAAATSVESGVLTPLSRAKGDLIHAIVDPLAVAFVVLVGLVGLKLMVFAVARTLRDIGRDNSDRVRRARRPPPPGRGVVARPPRARARVDP